MLHNLKLIRLCCSSSDSGAAAAAAAARTLVVVGGGPAGVYGAIVAKSACPSLRVLVLENAHFLSKVKISGGGRCNVTTGCFDDPMALSQQYPRGHKDLRGSYFRRHCPQDTAAWFEEHGVHLKTEEDGRMFPVTDDSRTIVDCLLNEARHIGVTLQSRVLVEKITRTGGCFDLQIKRKSEGTVANLHADFVLLATGSAPKGYELAERLGHSLIRPMPSLFTFKVADSRLHELAGVAFENVGVELEVLSDKKPKFTQEGALLTTHWGLSGPAILRLSAWAARELFMANYEGMLSVDFLPRCNLHEAKKMFEKHKSSSSKRKLGCGAPHETGMSKRFWQYLLSRQELDAEMLWQELPAATVHELAALVKKLPFQISGKGTFKEEFVTAGGIPLPELNMKTMESKKCPGLYLAGEVIDVDGITGGFNFQNAWTGGYIAGSSIASLVDTLQC